MVSPTQHSNLLRHSLIVDNSRRHIKMTRRRKSTLAQLRPYATMILTLTGVLLGLMAVGQLGPAKAQQAADQMGFVEQQLAAALAQLTGPSSAGNQQQQSAVFEVNPISGGQAASHEASGAASRSRSPRSIGEMFKKFFNGNKRTKAQSSGSSSSTSGGSSASSAASSPQSASASAMAAAREWEQQQALQQQQFQQSQAANMAAAQLAAAAANQHAVYASPFAAYSPQSSASALYPQFAPAYSAGSLVAWPSSAATHFGQTLRGPTTTLLGPSVMGAPASGSGPLYAAASQSYNSYAAPPTSQGAGQSTSGSGPQPAASHAHASVAPPPSGGSGGPGSSLDFHQVLDAFVRTSGFAPAGDQEAAAAQGYGGKAADGGVPVFSFKKLVSLPFYLSTEEKSLDGLGNAMPPSASSGYSLHSIPIMRRHVRRMSAIPSQQQQHQQLQAAEQRSERAQQQLYNNYANSINNQLASMTANNQIIQYLQQQQQQQQQQVDAFNTASVNEAMANYQLAGQSFKQTRPSPSNMAMASSVLAPTAVQPPSSPQSSSQISSIQHRQTMADHQQQHQQQQQQQQQDFQSLLNGYQSLTDPYSAALLSGSSGFVPSQMIGERYGSSQPPHRYTYPLTMAQFEPTSGQLASMGQLASGHRSHVSQSEQQNSGPAGKSGQDNQGELDQGSSVQSQQQSGPNSMISSNQQLQSNGSAQVVSTSGNAGTNGANFVQPSESQQQQQQ